MHLLEMLSGDAPALLAAWITAGFLSLVFLRRKRQPVRRLSSLSALVVAVRRLSLLSALVEAMQADARARRDLRAYQKGAKARRQDMVADAVRLASRRGEG